MRNLKIFFIKQVTELGCCPPDKPITNAIPVRSRLTIVRTLLGINGTQCQNDLQVGHIIVSRIRWATCKVNIPTSWDIYVDESRYYGPVISPIPFKLEHINAWLGLVAEMGSTSLDSLFVIIIQDHACLPCSLYLLFINSERYTVIL